MAYGYQRGNTWVYKTNRRDLPLLTDYPYLFASQYWTGQLYQDKSYIASPHTRTVRDRHLWTPPEKNLALKQTRSHIPTRRKRNKNGVHIAATDFCTLTRKMKLQTTNAHLMHFVPVPYGDDPMIFLLLLAFNYIHEITRTHSAIIRHS